MATGVWPLPDHNDDERELDLLEPSWADFLHGLRTGMRYVRDGSAGHKMRFMSFVQVRQQFDAFRDRYQAGDEAAVIEALRYALAEGVPAPYWLAQEAERRINRVYAEPVTMHTAFGLDSLFPAGGKKAASAILFR